MPLALSASAGFLARGILIDVLAQADHPFFRP
jgi:hypothetical protein